MTEPAPVTAEEVRRFLSGFALRFDGDKHAQTRGGTDPLNQWAHQLGSEVRPHSIVVFINDPDDLGGEVDPIPLFAGHFDQDPIGISVHGPKRMSTVRSSSIEGRFQAGSVFIPEHFIFELDEKGRLLRLHEMPVVHLANRYGDAK